MTISNSGTQKNINSIIGMTVEEAREFLKDTPYKAVRVVAINGEHLGVTMDYRLDRLNVTVVNDKIIIIDRIG